MTSNEDLESSEICLKTVREKATNWCYSVALKPLQVRQILFDPEAKINPVQEVFEESQELVRLRMAQNLRPPRADKTDGKILKLA